MAELKRINSREQFTPADRIDHKKMTELELFGSFYQHVTGKALDEKQGVAFSQIVESMRRAEREE